MDWKGRVRVGYGGRVVGDESGEPGCVMAEDLEADRCSIAERFHSLSVFIHHGVMTWENRHTMANLSPKCNSLSKPFSVLT